MSDDDGRSDGTVDDDTTGDAQAHPKKQWLRPAIPAHLFGGRARTSTVLLCALWLVLFGVFVYASPAADGGANRDSRSIQQQAPQTSVPSYQPQPQWEPTTNAPTTSTAPTTTPELTPSELPSTTSSEPQPTTRGGMFPPFVLPWETPEQTPQTTEPPPQNN